MILKYAESFPESEQSKIKIVKREYPPESHASQGRAERGVQTIQGLIRTKRPELEKSLDVILKPPSPLLAWLPQYVSWCYTHFQKASVDRRTPFERATLRTYDHPIGTFERESLDQECARWKDERPMGLCLLGRKESED